MTASSDSEHELALHNDTQQPQRSSSAPSVGSTTIGGPYRVGHSDEESCSYHTPRKGQSCREPRTCYECLNSDVAGISTGCLLAPSGFCKDMVSYEATLDFRRNTTGENLSITGWFNHFPSINTTYCEPTDEACVLCNEIINNGSMSQASQWGSGTENVSTAVERQFCRGNDGCVCVMACEKDNWEVNMPVECESDRSAPGDQEAPSADTTSYSSILIFYLVLQLALLAVFMYRRGLCKRVTRPPLPQPEGPYNNVNAIKSPSNRLRLSGWREMQNTLIEREKQRANQQPQYTVSPQRESTTAQIEDSTEAQLLSPSTSDQSYDAMLATCTHAQDDASIQRNSSSFGAQRSASFGCDVAVVEGFCEEKKADTEASWTGRTSSSVAMLEAHRVAV